MPYHAVVLRVRRAVPLAAALALFFVIAFPIRTLENHAHWDRVGWWPFLSPPIKPGDVAGNLLLGIPAGLAYGARFPASPLLAGVVIAPISLICEWAQVYTHGRFPSATDVVCNVGGALRAAHWMAGRRRRGEGR